MCRSGDPVLKGGADLDQPRYGAGHQASLAVGLPAPVPPSSLVLLP